MNTFSALWNKLKQSKKYREEFVAAQVKRGIPFQIRSLMKTKGLSQEELAIRSDLTQGVISRAANPNYGNLTLNTIIRIAAGFDVAFIGKFVSFSELGRWFTTLNEDDSAQVLSFEEECSYLEGGERLSATRASSFLENVPIAARREPSLPIPRVDPRTVSQFESFHEASR